MLHGRGANLLHQRGLAGQYGFMREVSLRDISNARGAGAPPRRRRLRYRVTSMAPQWSRLEVVIPVVYRFAANEETWASSGRERWKRDFERTAAQTWSRRYIVAANGFWGPDRVEVRVRVAAEPNARSDLLWHVWVLPWRVAGAPTCVSYDHSGSFPQGRDADGTVRWGPPFEHIALAQISAEDIDCGRQGAYSQRGTDHEVGHMLGLQHPTCVGNQRQCYGGSSEEQRRIMGLGSLVSADDYAWALRIMRRHEPTKRWRLESDRWVLDGSRRERRSVPTCG